MAKKKLSVIRGVLRVRAFPILDDAVYQGIGFGWNKLTDFFKTKTNKDGSTQVTLRLDDPKIQDFKTSLHQEIITAICESFDFPKDESE